MHPNGILLRRKKKENLKSILSEGSETQERTRSMIVYIKFYNSKSDLLKKKNQISSCFVLCVYGGALTRKGHERNVGIIEMFCVLMVVQGVWVYSFVKCCVLESRTWEHGCLFPLVLMAEVSQLPIFSASALLSGWAQPQLP